MDHLWTLLGIVLSSVLGFLVGTVIERQKWRNQRREKLDEAKRQAIVAAMAWVDPIEALLIQAESKVFSLLQGRIDEHDFLVSFPDVLTQLASMDLSPEQRTLLPKDIYYSGHKIHRGLESIKVDALHAASRMRLENESGELLNHSQTVAWANDLQHAANQLSSLRTEAATFRNRLSDEYRKTYS